MLAQAPQQEVAPRLSRLVAEALIERHGPRLIQRRAKEIGLPAPVAEVAVAACAATACDTRASRRRAAGAQLASS
jgi:hypothetical protein